LSPSPLAGEGEEAAAGPIYDLHAVDAARSALIVASYQYDDPGLRRLRAPVRDAEALARVLGDREIGDFDVRTLLNEPEYVIREAVAEFFADRRPDDLLLLHFSCHGVKDEGGELYFATINTKLRLLGATAVAADFVNRCMSRSRSRRVVLLLDCCYAGAFERGLAARADRGVAIEERFGGRGRAVITASSAMEYAFEGDELTDAGEPRPSVFTRALVEGLDTGEADRDQDGHVGLDELYDFVYDRVRERTPNQTPGKWTFGVQGELYIARRSRPVATPAPLGQELQQAIDHSLPSVRLAAVQELERVLHGGHAGLALGARAALERLVEDDSRAVARAAAAALGVQAAAAGPAEPPRPKPDVPPDRGPPPPVRPAPAAPQGRDLRPPAGPGPGSGSEAEARARRVLRLAGVLAIAAAAVELASLFPTYAAGFSVADYPDGTLLRVVVAALAAGAGAGLLIVPSRPMVSAGVLVGTALSAVWGLAGDIANALTRVYGEPGPGLAVSVVAGVLLLGAGGLTWFALTRTPAVRIATRPDRSLLSALIVLLGLAGAVVLLTTQVRLELVSVAGCWLTAMAVAVPALAVQARPRWLGVGLLVGWAGGGIGAVLFYAFNLPRSTIDPSGFVLFGGTLVALLLVTVPFALLPLRAPARRTAGG
jgi:Caspase domain